MTKFTSWRRVAPGALLVAGFAVSGGASMSGETRADHVDAAAPPEVPENIRVPSRNRAVQVVHAIGTQNYICLPSGSGFAWALFTPHATLFDRGIGRC